MASPGDAARFRAAGFDAYLNKPFLGRSLEQVLVQVTGEPAAPELVTRHSAELWRGGGFGLVLMDCRMPGMDGYEAARAIRAEERGARTPIVALTANATAEDHQRCREAGMDGVLTKPFRRGDLAQVLQQWLGAAAVTEAAAEEPALAVAHALSVADPPIDRGAWDYMAGQLGEDFPELIEAFRASAEDILTQLSSACERPRRDEALRLAHGLKSAAANLGAMALSRQAAALERASADADAAELMQRVDELRQEYARACGAIEVLAPGGDGAQV